MPLASGGMISDAYTRHVNRIVHCLDGVWDFAFLGAQDAADVDLAVPTWDRLPVPSAYDAYPAYAGLRGLAVYRRRVDVTPGTAGRLAFGAVGFWCRVSVDGVVVGEHSGAYSPFTVDVPAADARSREVTVLVDNRFDDERSPLHEPYYDFYQYGGIYRSVEWHELPGPYIESVVVRATNPAAGAVALSVVLVGAPDGPVELEVAFDGGEPVVHTVEVKDGIATIDAAVPSPRVWSPSAPALHHVRVTYEDDDFATRFGLRTVDVDGRNIVLNGKPITLLGYCRHEAHPQFGPALPIGQIVQDLQLLRDLGCNFIRGTHYPMDERFLDLCDEMGFLVWSETLGWGNTEKHFTSPAYADAHAAAVTEMVTAGINHPSIIFWAFLNEGASNLPASRAIYEDSVRLLRELDPTRLIAYASMHPDTDLNLDLVDVVSVNIYPGWYDDSDHDDPVRLVVPGIRRVAATIRERGFGDKPFLITEIGAEALRGWTDPLNGFWTEGYQADYLRAVCEEVVTNDDIAGLSLWQFNDIRSYHGPRAVKRARSFNNKGTLDEYRRPKASYAVVKAAFTAAPERERPAG